MIFYLYIATLWEKTFFNSSILRESHSERCTCSYCEDFNGTFGFALPEDKGRTSWRIIWWRKNKKLEILRWTLPKV